MRTVFEKKETWGVSTLIGLLAIGAAALFQPVKADPVSDRLTAIANGDHRSADNKARNAARHPVETLTFFGINDKMTVVELSPGGGWYSEILAPYLRDNGQYIAAGFPKDATSDYMVRINKSFAEKLAASPDLYNRVIVTELAPAQGLDIAPPGSADMVVTFRNLHSWMGAGQLEGVLAAAHKALKTGGILGVVQHRANPTAALDPNARNGYVNEDQAVALIEKAGFKLEAKSDVNANPKDTKDYEKGVWTLPPSYRLGDQDRAKYEAIGESDRMTLRFRKL